MGRLKRESLTGLTGLGERLREIRMAAGLSQMRVAELMGFNPTHGYKYILKLEKGSIPNPTLRTVVSFIEVCGADWPDLVHALPHANFLGGRIRTEGGGTDWRKGEDGRERTEGGGTEGRGRKREDRSPFPSLPSPSPASPRPRDPRPLRVRLREERIARREQEAQALWNAVSRTEEAAAGLLRTPAKSPDRSREYRSFIRLCCTTLHAYASARPRAIENELARLTERAARSGLDRTVLEDLARLCRESYTPTAEDGRGRTEGEGRVSRRGAPG